MNDYDRGRRKSRSFPLPAGRMVSCPAVTPRCFGETAFRRNLRLCGVVAGMVLIAFVTVRSECGGKPSYAPDGEWLDSTDVGVLWGRTRIYADKFWRACSLRTCEYPYVDIFLQVDSVKIPSNRKVYWYLLDPDDPADNITVDPNGSLPNDNVLRGRLLSCQHAVIDSLSDTLVSTQLDSGYPARTSIRLAVPPQVQDSFYGGDDFMLKVKLGSQTSTDVMVSTRMMVWKMMRAEVDCCEPDSIDFVIEILDSLYELVRHPLTGATYMGGNWDPDRCLYVDSRRQDIKDNFYNWVPYHIVVDTSGDDPVTAFATYFCKYVNYLNDYVYVHIAGDADWTPRWGPYPMGFATLGPGFSVVFAETAMARLWRKDTTAPDWQLYTGVYKVIMHEMGHQFMAREHCGTFDCIMRGETLSYPDVDPHFCPGCVHWARTAGAIQQFRR
jgi:hypothetical protein